MAQKRNHWLFASTVAVFLLGLALQKGFSLNLAPAFVGREGHAFEQALSLTENGDVLPEKEARQVIRRLNRFVAKPYTVQRNEWLEKIAQEYGIPALYLRSTNNLEDPIVRPNQQVWVQNKKGMVHVAREGEPLESVLKAYEKLGAKRESILASNPWDEITFAQGAALYLKEGVRVWVPEARRSFPMFVRPVAWTRISSRFGMRRHPLLKVRRWHDGFDMVAPYGAPVRAGESGVVTFAGWSGGYGNLVEIRHAKTTTRYGHLSQILVEVGQAVKRKQLLGRIGSSGLSTGPHLHFEVRRNSDGKQLNPRKFLF